MSHKSLVDVVVPDAAYSGGWSGDLSVPTKNAVYTKIQALVPGSDKQVLFNDGGAFGANTGLTFDKATAVLSVNGIPFTKGGGVDSFLIGTSNTSTQARTIAIGHSVNSTNQEAISLGSAIDNSGDGAIAIGNVVAVSIADGTAIGNNSVVDGQDAIAIGNTAWGKTQLGIAIGANAHVVDTLSTTSSIAIGDTAKVTSAQSGIAIGTSSEVKSGHDKGIALGDSSVTTKSNQLVIGSIFAKINEIRIGASAYATLDFNSVGSDRTYTFPNNTGTVALTSDIPAAGITRSIVITSGSATMGAATKTDYVYLVAGLHTMTLPTAVGNTNRYTVKNNHSASITVNTTSSQTIDGTTSITIAPSDAVDIISNNSNWFII